MKLRPVVKLHSGHYFNFIDLEWEGNSRIGIIDVAFSLAHINRYTGHRGNYTVAQHSVMVSRLVPPEWALEGLMHDAVEMILSDISSPVKQYLPDYKALYKSIEKGWLVPHFGLKYPFDPCVKAADLIMGSTEKRDIGNHALMLMNEEHDGDGTWDIYEKVTPLAQRLLPWSSEQSVDEFLHRYYEIVGRNPRVRGRVVLEG